MFVATSVKGNDPYRISGNQEFIVALVVQYKGEDATQGIEEVGSLAFIKGNDGLAIGCGLERVVRQLAPEGFVIVDLPVDRQDQVASGICQGLSAMLNINNRKPLVGEDCVFVGKNAAPVRPSVAQKARHRHRPFAKRYRITVNIQNASDATHQETPRSYSRCLLVKRTGTLSTGIQPRAQGRGLACRRATGRSRSRRISTSSSMRRGAVGGRG